MIRNYSIGRLHQLCKLSLEQLCSFVFSSYNTESASKSRGSFADRHLAEIHWEAACVLWIAFTPEGLGKRVWNNAAEHSLKCRECVAERLVLMKFFQAPSRRLKRTRLITTHCSGFSFISKHGVICLSEGPDSESMACCAARHVRTVCTREPVWWPSSGRDVCVRCIPRGTFPWKGIY